MTALDERRAQHQRYKEDVQREGKAFYPFAMFHDTVMSLVVVSVIVGLACVWYFTADGTDSGWRCPSSTCGESGACCGGRWRWSPPCSPSSRWASLPTRARRPRSHSA